MKSAGEILIVDDSGESLRLLSELLRAEGYSVRPADSGELALAAVAMSPPELILLDMRMPGLDGIEVCRRLKVRPDSRDIPVIFLSASIDFEDRLEGFESGAVDFINKPFRREELLARIRTHLELARLRKNLEHRVAERTFELQTANKQLSDELELRRRVEGQLRESEYRFISMADTAPVGIWISDADGLVTYVSQWVLTLTGWTKEAIQGNGWVSLLHADDAPRTIEAIREAKAKRAPFLIEYRIKRYDGQLRWAAVSGLPRFVRGEFVGHIGSIVDITELKRSQEQALANQKLESLGVLAAGVAHDFNNLLSTILAHSDLLMHEVPSESPGHESVTTISKVAIRASEIVNLLLAYAGHADSGGSESFDLSSAIEEMAQLLKVSMPPGATLTLNLAKELPQVWANMAQIRQVILNLIINAFEALEAGTGTVCVSTSQSSVTPASPEPAPIGLAQGEYILLEVADSGCGMTEDVKAKIFDPFFSTKFLGRGLGLASVQGIVRGCGGAVAVASTAGQGSTFRVWLPCAGSRPATDVQAPETRAMPAGTVLIVDDETGLRHAVASALKRAGFSTLVASDGFTAVQSFAEHSSEISAVILDLTLPGLSGQEVCAEMGRLRPDVPVLITTGQAITENLDLGKCNAKRLLRKPYRLKELIGTLREMIAAAESARATCS